MTKLGKLQRVRVQDQSEENQDFTKNTALQRKRNIDYVNSIMMLEWRQVIIFLLQYSHLKNRLLDLRSFNFGMLQWKMEKHFSFKKFDYNQLVPDKNQKAPEMREQER